MAKTFFKDQAQAEDLTHDVFERLWRNNQFEEDSSLRSYLLLMTRSMALNRLKQGKNRQSILERWRTEFRVEAPSSEPELQAAERSARLQVCLAKLKTASAASSSSPFARQNAAADCQGAQDALGSVKTAARRGLIAIRKMLEDAEQQPAAP